MRGAGFAAAAEMLTDMPGASRGKGYPQAVEAHVTCDVTWLNLWDETTISTRSCWCLMASSLHQDNDFADALQVSDKGLISPSLVGVARVTFILDNLYDWFCRSCANCGSIQKTSTESYVTVNGL